MQNPSLEQLEMIGSRAFSCYFFDRNKSDIIISFIKEPTQKRKLETIEKDATYTSGLGSRLWNHRMTYNNREEMDNMIDDYCKWAIADQKHLQEAVVSIGVVLKTKQDSREKENKVTEEETLQKDYTPKERAKEITMAIEKEIEKSLAKEFKKGFQQGAAEGERKGMKRGKREERMLIAKKMMKVGLSDLKIIEITGLTQEQINDLKN